MEDKKKVQILQVAYAGALADAVLQMGRQGILEKVTAQKKKEQTATGKARAGQFGITSPEEVFLTLSEIFSCAAWRIEHEPRGFLAEAKACKLCALAKKLGAPSPCHICCLDPMEAMVKGLDPGLKFTVHETLFDGLSCLVSVGKGGPGKPGV